MLNFLTCIGARVVTDDVAHRDLTTNLAAKPGGNPAKTKRVRFAVEPHVGADSITITEPVAEVDPEYPAEDMECRLEQTRHKRESDAKVALERARGFQTALADSLVRDAGRNNPSEFCNSNDVHTFGLRPILIEQLHLAEMQERRNR